MPLRFLSLILVVILTSCHQKKSFSRVDVDMLFIDSISVRAIAPIDTGAVWFAANRGMVGLIKNKNSSVAQLLQDGSPVPFRSLAHVGGAAFVLSIEDPALLYRIDLDGSEISNIDLVYKEEGAGVFYDAMTFWNAQEGLAIGDPVEGCLSVIKTVDGGATWTKLPCDDLPMMGEGEAAFAASNGNIAVMGDQTWIVTGGKKSRVFYSPDKGLTWNIFETPIVQGAEMTGMFSVDFYNERLGVVFGGDWSKQEENTKNKALTMDGGATWTLLADGQDPGYCSSVRFVPNGGGERMVAVGPKGIYSSGDQGASWRQLDQTAFYTIRFVNDTLAFAGGPNRVARLIFRY